jgi:hypothetical protein
MDGLQVAHLLPSHSNVLQAAALPGLGLLVQGGQRGKGKESGQILNYTADTWVEVLHHSTASQHHDT